MRMRNFFLHVKHALQVLAASVEIRPNRHKEALYMSYNPAKMTFCVK